MPRKTQIFKAKHEKKEKKSKEKLQELIYELATQAKYSIFAQSPTTRSLDWQ